MNHEEFVKRIAAGESAEDIIAAVQKAAAEVRAAEEAKANEKVKSQKMDEIATVIADAMNEYAHVAGIDCDPLQVTEVRELLNQFLPIVESLKNVKVHVAKAEPKVVKAVKKFAKPEDVFAAFFNENGWF